MKSGSKALLKTYVLEFLVYGVLLVAYYFLVLHLLGDWLNGLFHKDRKLYAFTALALIAAQGILLDLVTRFLLGLVTPAQEDS
jgi:hypothetical protein